jgi:hypothetical protein
MSPTLTMSPTSPPTTPSAMPSPAAPTTTRTTPSTNFGAVVAVDGDGAVAGDGIALGVVGVER